MYDKKLAVAEMRRMEILIQCAIRSAEREGDVELLREFGQSTARNDSYARRAKASVDFKQHKKRLQKNNK